MLWASSVSPEGAVCRDKGRSSGLLSEILWISLSPAPGSLHPDSAQFPPASDGVEMTEAGLSWPKLVGQGAAQDGKGQAGNHLVSKTVANTWSESRIREDKR